MKEIGSDEGASATHLAGIQQVMKNLALCKKINEESHSRVTSPSSTTSSVFAKIESQTLKDDPFVDAKNHSSSSVTVTDQTAPGDVNQRAIVDQGVFSLESHNMTTSADQDVYQQASVSASISDQDRGQRAWQLTKSLAHHDDVLKGQATTPAIADGTAKQVAFNPSISHSGTSLSASAAVFMPKLTPASSFAANFMKRFGKSTSAPSVTAVAKKASESSPNKADELPSVVAETKTSSPVSIDKSCHIRSKTSPTCDTEKPSLPSKQATDENDLPVEEIKNNSPSFETLAHSMHARVTDKPKVPSRQASSINTDSSSESKKTSPPFQTLADSMHARGISKPFYQTKEPPKVNHMSVEVKKPMSDFQTLADSMHARPADRHFPAQESLSDRYHSRNYQINGGFVRSKAFQPSTFPKSSQSLPPCSSSPPINSAKANSFPRVGSRANGDTSHRCRWQREPPPQLPLWLQESIAKDEAKARVAESAKNAGITDSSPVAENTSVMIDKFPPSQQQAPLTGKSSTHTSSEAKDVEAKKDTMPPASASIIEFPSTKISPASIASPASKRRIVTISGPDRTVLSRYEINVEPLKKTADTAPTAATTPTFRWSPTPKQPTVEPSSDPSLSLPGPRGPELPSLVAALHKAGLVRTPHNTPVKSSNSTLRAKSCEFSFDEYLISDEQIKGRNCVEIFECAVRKKKSDAERAHVESDPAIVPGANFKYNGIPNWVASEDRRTYWYECALSIRRGSGGLTEEQWQHILQLRRMHHETAADRAADLAFKRGEWDVIAEMRKPENSKYILMHEESFHQMQPDHTVTPFSTWKWEDYVLPKEFKLRTTTRKAPLTSLDLQLSKNFDQIDIPPPSDSFQLDPSVFGGGIQYDKFDCLRGVYREATVAQHTLTAQVKELKLPSEASKSESSEGFDEPVDNQFSLRIPPPIYWTERHHDDLSWIFKIEAPKSAADLDARGCFLYMNQDNIDLLSNWLDDRVDIALNAPYRVETSTDEFKSGRYGTTGLAKPYHPMPEELNDADGSFYAQPVNAPDLDEPEYDDDQGFDPIQSHDEHLPWTVQHSTAHSCSMFISFLVQQYKLKHGIEPSPVPSNEGDASFTSEVEEDMKGVEFMVDPFHTRVSIRVSSKESSKPVSEVKHQIGSNSGTSKGFIKSPTKQTVQMEAPVTIKVTPIKSGNPWQRIKVNPFIADLDSEIKPKINVYVRPAAQCDVTLITALHNDWIEKHPDTAPGQRLVTDDYFSTILNSTDYHNLPFFVACSHWTPRGRRRDGQRTHGENVIGFAYLQPWSSNPAFDTTYETFLYVSTNVLYSKKGVGNVLLDRIMTAVDPDYIPLLPTTCYDMGREVSTFMPGGMRGSVVAVKLVANLYFTDNSTDNSIWRENWLGKWGWSLATRVKRIGKGKNGWDLNLIMMEYDIGSGGKRGVDAENGSEKFSSSGWDFNSPK